MDVGLHGLLLYSELNFPMCFELLAFEGEEAVKQQYVVKCEEDGIQRRTVLKRKLKSCTICYLEDALKRPASDAFAGNTCC